MASDPDSHASTTAGVTLNSVATDPIESPSRVRTSANSAGTMDESSAKYPAGSCCMLMTGILATNKYAMLLDDVRLPAAVTGSLRVARSTGEQCMLRIRYGGVELVIAGSRNGASLFRAEGAS